MICQHILQTGKNAGSKCGKKTPGKKHYCNTHSKQAAGKARRTQTVRTQAAILRKEPLPEPVADQGAGVIDRNIAIDEDPKVETAPLNSSIWFVTINSNKSLVDDKFDNDPTKLSLEDARKFQKFCKFLMKNNKKIMDLFICTNKTITDLDSVLAFPAEITYKDVEIGEEKRRLHCHASIRMTFDKSCKLQLDMTALRELGKMILGYTIYANVSASADVARIRELYLSKQHDEPLADFLDAHDD